MGPLWDSQFWGDVLSNAKNLRQNAVAQLDKFGRLPEQADHIAESMFPGSARDSSTKNAFRHALGTGMLAQELGGGPVAATAAKGAGYLWEGLGALDRLRYANEGGRQDMLHDLNANAVGASVAQRTGSQAELVEALRQMALQSVPSKPPSAFAPSPGYLTRTER